ncbi:hypothetical protein ACFE04_029592 [Oxalis oulophora]
MNINNSKSKGHPAGSKNCMLMYADCISLSLLKLHLCQLLVCPSGGKKILPVISGAFIMYNQSKLRHDLLTGVEDAVVRGDTVGAQVGQRVIPPSSDARLSTTSGTMMLMNEEIAVFNQYKDRFHQSDITINDKRIELGTQLKRAIPMTLQSLLTQYDELRQGQTYICTANVVGIDDAYPWCYLGCKFCTRRVEHHETSYWCKKCGVVDGTLSR